MNIERSFKIFLNDEEKLDMKLICTSGKPNAMYFTKYQAIFNPDEWVAIDLIEGDLIPLINQLDEINRKDEIKEYNDFRYKLNSIWETYKLERESMRLKKIK